MVRIAFSTLGCKVNTYETAVLEGLAEKKGWMVVPPEADAEVYVVNSCTVTAQADQKSRQTLRHLRRLHPDAVLVLTGCYPQAYPDRAPLPEADIVTGTKNRTRLPELIEQFLRDREKIVSVPGFVRPEPFEPMQAEKIPDHTRAFIKIQDGCDRYCAYCAIPYARGPVRSKPLPELREELEKLAAAGYREAVLSGINLPCYGGDLGLRLVDAVETACSVEGILRVRLGSLEPELLTEEDALRMQATGKVCPQFHLSLQSGAAGTLKRMNRHYTPEEYARQGELLRRIFPDAALTTDVMVGFPGETEAEFAESLDFVRAMGFARVHVFPYSRREGTRAAAYPDQVTREEKARRAAEMTWVAEEGRKAFLSGQIGMTAEVLFEQKEKGLWHGYTPNYTPVFLTSSEGCADLNNRILRVRLTGLYEDGMTGEPVEDGKI